MIWSLLSSFVPFLIIIFVASAIRKKANEDQAKKAKKNYKKKIVKAKKASQKEKQAKEIKTGLKKAPEEIYSSLDLILDEALDNKKVLEKDKDFQAVILHPEAEDTRQLKNDLLDDFKDKDGRIKGRDLVIAYEIMAGPLANREDRKF